MSEASPEHAQAGLEELSVNVGPHFDLVRRELDEQLGLAGQNLSAIRGREAEEDENRSRLEGFLQLMPEVGLDAKTGVTWASFWNKASYAFNPRNLVDEKTLTRLDGRFSTEDPFQILALLKETVWMSLRKRSSVQRVPLFVLGHNALKDELLLGVPSLNPSLEEYYQGVGDRTMWDGIQRYYPSRQVLRFTPHAREQGAYDPYAPLAATASPETFQAFYNKNFGKYFITSRAAGAVAMTHSTLRANTVRLESISKDDMEAFNVEDRLNMLALLFKKVDELKQLRVA